MCVWMCAVPLMLLVFFLCIGNQLQGNLVHHLPVPDILASSSSSVKNEHPLFFFTTCACMQSPSSYSFCRFWAPNEFLLIFFFFPDVYEATTHTCFPTPTTRRGRRAKGGIVCPLCTVPASSPYDGDEVCAGVCALPAHGNRDPCSTHPPPRASPPPPPLAMQWLSV